MLLIIEWITVFNNGDFHNLADTNSSVRKTISLWNLKVEGLVLWHINNCRLFNAKFIFIHIKFYLKQFSLV